MIKLVVFGGRDFCRDSDGEYVVDHVLVAYRVLTRLLSKSEEEIFVIDGEAHGGDEVGYRWRKSNDYAGERFPAKWKDENGKYDPTAGFQRNNTLVENGTHFVGFWDGVSGGTNDTRKKVIKKGAPLRMFKYEVIDGSLIVTSKPEWDK